MNKTLLCLFVFCLSLGFAATCHAAAAGIPTNINASRMDYNADKQIVVFSGNVHVKRPDFELWSDLLTVYLANAGGQEGNQSMSSMKAGDISVIVAEHNVIIKSGTREAQAGKATYTVATDELKLEGPPTPWLRDKGNTLSAHTIFHYIKANKSSFKGAVNATFFTPEGSSPLPKN